MPGALGIEPHASAGAPSACGPLNDLAIRRTWAGVIFATLPLFCAAAVLRNRIVLSIVPKFTMFHGSGAFFWTLNSLIAAAYGARPRSLGSPNSELAIPYVQCGKSP